jgi:hypothetical protein
MECFYMPKYTMYSTGEMNTEECIFWAITQFSLQTTLVVWGQTNPREIALRKIRNLHYKKIEVKNGTSRHKIEHRKKEKKRSGYRPAEDALSRAISMELNRRVYGVEPSDDESKFPSTDPSSSSRNNWKPRGYSWF